VTTSIRFFNQHGPDHAADFADDIATIMIQLGAFTPPRAG
jgi:hypothetical protein